MLKVWRWLQFNLHSTIDFHVSYVVKPGMKVWECNLSNGEIGLAEVKEFERYNFFVGTIKSKEVVMRDGCIYEFALRGESAIKKFEKRILEHYKK